MSQPADPELWNYVYMLMRDLGITRENIISDYESALWTCAHGLVSCFAVKCRLGCARGGTEVIYRTFLDDAISREYTPSEAYPAPAARSEYTGALRDPELMKSAQTAMNIAGVTRDTLLSLAMPMWVCQHGLVSCFLQKCQFGCDAHDIDKLVVYQPGSDTVITRPGREIVNNPYGVEHREYTRESRVERPDNARE
jgi:hypothetical protein